MTGLTNRIENFFLELSKQNRLRSLFSIAESQADQIIIGGKKYINFSSNNYLALAQHPELLAAAQKAAQDWGVGSGASRLVTGSLKIHHELEEAVADFKGTEAALVFNSGYQANATVIPALARENDVIFSDEFCHASLIDGMRLSKSNKIIFKHLNLEDLEEKMAVAQSRRKTDSLFFIVTESVFSMDGDVTDLEKMMSLAEKFDAIIFLDDAHATGVLGDEGRGLVSTTKINPKNENLIQMGTFSKALGSFGAYVACTKKVCDYLINTARGFIFATSLPPSVIAANRVALEICVKDLSRREILTKNRKAMENIFSGFGTPIFPVILGTEEAALKKQSKLKAQGIWATAIRPPTVPAGLSRIRFTITAGHTQEQINFLSQFFS